MLPNIDKYIKVAVIGRSNVGKSTLFNRLAKTRKSIVDDAPGVTRDRLYADIEWNGKNITLIDTGGLVSLNGKTNDEITEEVKRHVLFAIDESDFVIFLVDGQAGITAQDEKIAAYLRKIKNKKRIFLAVNKIDTEKQTHLIHEFYSLGLNEPYPISALSGSSGLADILDKISNSSVTKTLKVPIDKTIRIAIVGKPNVGKSSILNCLVGEERSIVTQVPGTTRDSVDTKVNLNNKCYLLIDTAGLRRKSKVSSSIERYATLRAVSSIDTSDVVLLVVDAMSNISDQDQKIASLIKRRYKGSIILVNKWDLVTPKDSNTTSRFKERILSALHFINYSKVLFTSAKENKNIFKVWSLIDETCKNYENRISTGKLNKLLENTVLLKSPPSKKGKLLKIYYATQANSKPPELVLFVNDSSLITDAYQKFLEKEIRKNFDFTGSPIKFVYRSKSEKSGN